VIYKIDQSGMGDRHFWAASGFQATARDGRMILQSGLAIDPEANLYSENPSSDDQFGGRIFKFFQPNGARAFTGEINYYSFDLQFAHPVMSGPMVIKPDPNPILQDLYIVDNTDLSIKAVPVNQTFDANRRVGQPFAVIPPGGVGRVIDMKFDPRANLFVMDGWRVLRYQNGQFVLYALFTTE